MTVIMIINNDLSHIDRLALIDPFCAWDCCQWSKPRWIKLWTDSLLGGSQSVSQSVSLSVTRVTLHVLVDYYWLKWRRIAWLKNVWSYWMMMMTLQQSLESGIGKWVLPWFLSAMTMNEELGRKVQVIRLIPGIPLIRCSLSRVTLFIQVNRI